MTDLILIGSNQAVIPLLESLGAAGHHVVLIVSQDDGLASSAMRLFPAARITSDWETALEEMGATPAIVCGSSESENEAFRRLLSESRPVAYLPEVKAGLELIYELSLVLDDSNATVIPVWSASADSTMRSLLAALEDEQFGRVQNIQFERQMVVEGLTFSRESVESLMFHDLQLLNRIGGGYSRVTSVQSTSDGEQVVQSTTTLGGDGKADAVWHLQSAVDADQWRLRILTSRGQLVLSGKTHDDWSCTVQTSGEIEFAVAPAEDHQAVRFTDQLVKRLGEPRQPDDWIELTRVHEFIDASRRSLRRKRTIDLHFETASELSQFKTQMTAIGCGVMLFTLMGLVIYLMVGEIFDLPPFAMQLLRLLWVAPIVIFLALQLLVFVARPSTSVKSTESPQSTSEKSEG